MAEEGAGVRGRHGAAALFPPPRLRAHAAWGLAALLACCCLALLAGCGPRQSLPPPVPPPAAPEGRAPQQAASPPGDYFPHGDEDEWEFRVTDAEHPQPYGVRLASLGEMELGGLKAHYFQMRQGQEVLQMEGFRVASDAVRMVAFGTDGTGRIEPPMTVLRLPPKAGDAWRWQGTLRSEDGDVQASAEFRVTGPEQVETPAGSFAAFRVERTVTRAGDVGGQPIRNTQWYAPGVGLVKQVVREPGGDTATVLVRHRVRPPQTPEEGSEPQAGDTQQPAGR